MKTKKLQHYIYLVCACFGFQAAFAASDIVIDAGHGGKDPGAVRHYKGKLHLEKHFTLDMSKQLQRQFTQQGYSVAMTRSIDKSVSLRNRLNYARAHCKKLFLSVHVDSAPTPRASGVNAFAAGRNNAMIQRSMHIARNVQKTFNPMRQVRRENFFVLKNANCPTLLVEMGYITNDRDLDRLLNKKERSRMVNTLGNVLDKSIKQQDKKAQKAQKTKAVAKNTAVKATGSTPKPASKSGNSAQKSKSQKI